MDWLTWWQAIGGGVAFAATIVFTGISLEHYKRHRDTQNTAAIFAAEIGALLLVAERDDLVD